MSTEAKRIIFYRIGAIGDIIHTLPLIKYTKKKNPQASVELIIGSEAVAGLLQVSAPYVDKVWLINHESALNKPFKFFASRSKFLWESSTELALYESIQENPVDDFIYLHSNFFKAHLVNFLFMKASKLFVYKNRPELTAVVNYTLTYFPEIESLLRENTCAMLDYKTLERKALAQPSNDDYVCIVLGVGNVRPSRAYPLQKWIWLIEEILQKSSRYIYILGGPDEKELSVEFERMIQSRQEHLKIPVNYSRIKNLIGKTNLIELAKILLNTKKLYSADTGILHIAAALDVPIEAVFTITSPRRFAPFNPDARVIKAECSCEASCKAKLKHCENLTGDYASCAWLCEFSA